MWRHLPRRIEGVREYDFEKNQAMPRDFPDKLQEEPSKLLLVWLYRGLSGEPKWTKEKVKKLLGDVTVNLFGFLKLIIFFSLVKCTYLKTLSLITMSYGILSI